VKSNEADIQLLLTDGRIKIFNNPCAPYHIIIIYLQWWYCHGCKNKFEFEDLAELAASSIA
jgi:hypothetical protein